MATKFDLSKFTKSSRDTLKRAESLASKSRHQHVTQEHTLVCMLEQVDNPAPVLLGKLELDIKRLGLKTIEELELMPKTYRSADQVFVDRALQDILEQAQQESSQLGDDFVTDEHVLIAMASATKGFASKALRDAGATPEKLRDELKKLRSGKKVTSPEGGSSDTLAQFTTDLTAMAAQGKLQQVIGRNVELRRMMQVLSRRSKNNPVVLGEPGVGKTALVEALAQRIVSDDVPIGLKGKKILSLDVGSLVAGTSLRGQFEGRIKTIVNEIIASNGQILLFIDELHTIAGAGDGATNAAGLLKPALARGELSIIGTTTPDEYRQYIETDPALERRFQSILLEEPTIEECISILRGIKQPYEIHHSVQIRDEALVAAAKMTSRYLPDRALPDKAIDAIDEAASRLRIEIDSKPTELDALERRIISLEIERQAILNEASAADDLKVIDTKVAQAQEQAGALREQWEQEKVLLDKVTAKKEEYEACKKDMEEAQRKGELGRAAEFRHAIIPRIEREIKQSQDALDGVSQNQRLLKNYVDENDIAQVVGDWTGIPVNKMVESEKEKLLQMPARLKEFVIGQDNAVDIIAEKVRTARAGLQEGKRPIGNFMFVGPTGVGKTELAKAIAQFLFDDSDAIVRIDMSEYMEQSKVNTLIGSARGYVGSEQGGILTEAVRLKPYSVVLFDEAEKAHPDVFNILLQLMDEGRLTDSQGRRVDFSNTLIILTSNAGSKQIMELIQGGSLDDRELSEQIKKILLDFFRPEFLGRLDDVIPFRSLNLEDIKKIARIQERKIKKLLVEQKMELKLEPAALEFIAQQGFEPEYGARPLKRSFAENLQQPLAVDLLEGKFKEGDLIVADLADDMSHLVFNKG